MPRLIRPHDAPTHRAHLRRIAAVITLVGSTILGVTAPARAQAEPCDWTSMWPEDGAVDVSRFRRAFFIARNMQRCEVDQVVLVRDDGVEVPISGSADRTGMYVRFEQRTLGPELALEPARRYEIRFFWFEETPTWRYPATPYRFTTSDETEPPPPLNLQELSIERFELFPDEGRVLFEASWSDPSPVHRLHFAFHPFTVMHPPQSSIVVQPAQTAPDLRYEFFGAPFPRRERSCVGVRVHDDAQVNDVVGSLTECVDVGCSTTSSAPSLIGWVALALLGWRRRRRAGGASSLPRS
jgi:uncharacterized protein (TIGR03382 family)